MWQTRSTFGPYGNLKLQAGRIGLSVAAGSDHLEVHIFDGDRDGMGDAGEETMAHLLFLLLVGVDYTDNDDDDDGHDHDDFCIGHAVT